MTTDRFSEIVTHLMATERHSNRAALEEEVRYLEEEYRHVMGAGIPEHMPLGESASALTLMRHYPD